MEIINSRQCGVESRKAVITKRLGRTFATRVSTSIPVEMAGNRSGDEWAALQPLLTPSGIFWLLINQSGSSAIGCSLHTHTESLPLIPLPSHNKSQGLGSCFHIEREISDSEEFPSHFFNYIVYTNKVKNSSKDTKANVPLHKLSTQHQHAVPSNSSPEKRIKILRVQCKLFSFLTIYLFCLESVLQKPNNVTCSAKTVSCPCTE